jgi:hypothetical protein
MKIGREIKKALLGIFFVFMAIVILIAILIAWIDISCSYNPNGCQLADAPARITHKETPPPSVLLPEARQTHKTLYPSE